MYEESNGRGKGSQALYSEHPAKLIALSMPVQNLMLGNPECFISTYHPFDYIALCPSQCSTSYQYRQSQMRTAYINTVSVTPAHSSSSSPSMGTSVKQMALSFSASNSSLQLPFHTMGRGAIAVVYGVAIVPKTYQSRSHGRPASSKHFLNHHAGYLFDLLISGRARCGC